MTHSRPHVPHVIDRDVRGKKVILDPTYEETEFDQADFLQGLSLSL